MATAHPISIIVLVTGQTRTLATWSPLATVWSQFGHSLATRSPFGHRSVTVWSQFGHRLATRSPFGHRLVTVWSQFGHRLVTVWSQFGYKDTVYYYTTPRAHLFDRLRTRSFAARH